MRIQNRIVFQRQFAQDFDLAVPYAECGVFDERANVLLNETLFFVPLFYRKYG